MSPAERPPLDKVGTVSSLPEKFGADFMWQSPNGLVGVQRKTQSDLIASVRNRAGDPQGNRLGREVEQMRQLEKSYLVIEALGTYTVSGELLSKHQSWSLKEQWGIEVSLQREGITVLHSRTVTETMTLIEHLYKKSQEAEKVSSLLARPGPQKNGWGKFDDRNTGIYFLTGIPGIGIELAGRIWDHFGGLPIGWTITKEELLEVSGIGKKKVNELWRTIATPITKDWWLPWLAALIDGEGSIRFVQNGPKEHSFSPEVSIFNCSEELLERVKELTQLGTLYERDRNPAHRPGLQWVTLGRDAEAILKAALPYLIVKKQHASVVIDLMSGIVTDNSRPVDQEEVSRRLSLKARLTELNTKGRL